MASTNPYASFTITQPFLGAPLQFQPALGTKELEELIDAYVIGTACKQDKFSEVTLDFYNNATVDLNTGALTRTYTVFPSPWSGNAFEQSPNQSQSSGFSPIFTPSPGSSATFGDSAYGSMSMTPPNRHRGARITKKAKKDTPKAAEARLPGFSIMTKDGIDVTNSAGRGTKTKEQREHAHLMRIMKACDACKKKKIRCDPSHRRSHNDMSRTSTSTTQTSSSGRLDPSPAASTPSLSRATTHASQGSLPSFNPSNPIDDFVLFPEDSTSWDADMSFPELETQDLGQFNFDINDIDLTSDYSSMTTDNSFDFSFDRQPSSFQSGNSFGYTPVMNDQYGLDQWAEPQGFMPVSHTRPHPAGPTNDSGPLEANWQSGWLQTEPLISPRTTTFADNSWPDTFGNHPQIAQNSDASNRPLISESPDWSLFESSILTSGSSPGDETANSEPSQASALRRSRKRRAVDEQESGRSSSGSFEQLGLVNVIRASEIRILDPSDQQQREAAGCQPSSAVSSLESPIEQELQQFSAGSSRASREISRMKIACQLVSKSLDRVEGASSEYSALGTEIRELQTVLERLESSQHAMMILSDSTLMTIESLRIQLQVLSARVKRSRASGPSMLQRYNKLDTEFHPDHLRELQVIARRLVRSLCARINSPQGEDTRTNFTTSNAQMLTSGRNLQLSVSSTVSHDHERHIQALDSGVQISSSIGGSSDWQTSRAAAWSGIEASESLLQRANGNIETLDIYVDVDGVCSPTRNEGDFVAGELLAVREVPRYSMLVKTKPNDLVSQGFEDSRLSERPEQKERDLVAGTDSNELASLLAPTPDESYCTALRLSRKIVRQEQTGGLATCQQGRAIIAIPSSDGDRAIWNGTDNEQPITRNSPLHPQVAITQEVSPLQSSISTSLQATTSHQSSYSFVLRALPSNVFDLQYSFAAGLVIIGSLALASNVRHHPPNIRPTSQPLSSSTSFSNNSQISSSGLDISAHLPYLFPFALSLLISRQDPTTALLAGAFLFTSSLSLPFVQAFRTNCTQWLGNEPFAATAKLILCATLISSELLSSLNLSVIAVAALHYLSGTRDACSSGSGVGVLREESVEEGLGSYGSWLGMLDVLSLVAAV